MSIGIRLTINKTSNTAVTSSVTPVTVGFSTPLGVSKQIKLRYWIPLSVGAAGGVRAIPSIPSGATVNALTFKLFDTIAPSLATGIQAATSTPTAFTSALANAGNHWMEVEMIVTNGATAGSVDLLMAQNTSNGTPMTALAGGTVDIVMLP